MKPKDIIQLRQFCEGVHWIYARVLSVGKEGLLVEVCHPGNTEHGVQKLVDAKDCRTKADIQKLHDQAKGHAAERKPEDAAAAMATADEFIAHAMKPDEKGHRPGHKGLCQPRDGKLGVVAHYESQLKKFEELAR